MAWAMELSPAGFDEMLADLARMDKKTGRAYVQLLGYLRRFGSVPSGERAMASVLGVTPRFLREVAWPLIEDRLVLSDDKRRYYSPDITRVDRSTAKPAVPPEVSEVRRAAARSSHAARRSAGWSPQQDFAALGDANDGANGVQNPADDLQTIVQTVAKLSANSIPVASGLQDFAGDFAGDQTHARAPSLASFPSSQPTANPTESKEVSEREGERARESAAVSGLQTTVQTGLQTDANRPAKLPANARPVPPPPKQTVLPADWEPTEQALASIETVGRDPAPIVAGFRAHYKKRGSMMADWDAAFESWWLKQPQFDPAPSPQTHLTMAVPGGRPDKDSWKLEEARAIQARRAARNGQDADDGPIIEGMVG